MLIKHNNTRIEQELRQLRKTISDPLDLRQLLLFLITTITKHLQLDSICFLLHNIDNDDYELMESIKLSKNFKRLDGKSALVQFFIGKRDFIFYSKIKALIIKLEKDKQSKKPNLELLKKLAFELESLQSELSIPLFKDNKLLGILSLGAKQNAKNYGKQDLNFLNIMMDEYSFMIESAIKHDELKSKEKELNLLYKVGTAVSSLHEFKKAFDIIARNSSILLKAPKVMILLYDEYDVRFNIKKTFGFSDFQVNRIYNSVRFKECTQVIVGRNEGILIRNISDDTLYDEGILEELGVNSTLSTPLFDQNIKVIGELRAMRPSSQKPFNERDLEIASSLANNITVAIDNSSIFQKSEEHLLELSTIYNITRMLTNEFELDKIQKKVCTVFTDMINFKRVILYILGRNNQLTPEEASGWEKADYEGIVLDVSKTLEGKALIEGRILQITPAQLEGYDRTAVDALKLVNFALLPLLITNKKPIGVIVIDMGEKELLKENFNPRLLTSIAHQSAVIIENARLYKESEELNQKLKKEQARTAKELQIAHYIQQGLLSAKYPENKSINIYSTNLPCRAVGGDFFNFIKYDENKLGVVIGDVSGKGIPAALLMTMTSSMFSEFGKHYSSPEAVLVNANDSLRNYLSRSPIFYVTAFYAVIDFEHNLLRYCKAGHNPPILYRAIKEDVLFLDTEGTYLGTFEDGGYMEKSISISNLDKLVLYTDGITESRNVNKVLFGKERLASLVKEYSYLPADKLAKVIIGEVEKFNNYSEFSDDLTLVIIDFKDLIIYNEKPLYKINYKIKSNLNEVKKVVADFLKKIEALEISSRLFNHLRLAVSEATINAMEHGNKNDEKKNINIRGLITNRRIELTVSDSGLGFDVKKLCYSENQTDINHRGRGITAIRACMDEVFYNEKGNEITIIKYIL